MSIETFFIFTVRNKVAKVMFLQASVCPQGGGGVCLSAWWDSRHPPPLEQTPPPEQTPPGADTLQEQTPLRADTPPRSRHTPQEQTPPPEQTPPGADTPQTKYTPWD